jgi:hypothetical protein
MNDLTDLSDMAPAWREPEPVVTRYIIHTLNQHVYLRDVLAFGEVELGVHVALLGVLAALWTCPAWTEGERVNDQVGNRLAYWLRVTMSPESAKLIFAGTADYRAFRALLAG